MSNSTQKSNNYYKKKLEKEREKNVKIVNGKKIINSISVSNKAKKGQQTHGRANKAGTGLNSQEGNKKTKEDRKLENRTEEDEKNEKALWLVNFQDKDGIELVKTFNEKEDITLNKKNNKKLSKKEKIILENKERILKKKIIEEKEIIKKIEKCSTYEEVEYFYKTLKECQVLYLFTSLKWCYDKYNEILNMEKVNKTNKMIKTLLLKIKILILHIEDREFKDIDKELVQNYEDCKNLIEDMNSIELQLKSKILPKPMNDFKDIQLKADFWQVGAITKIHEGKNLLICAPTSTGKTFIAMAMAINNKKTLFVVPNESVAIQVTGVLSTFYNGNYCVFTKKFNIKNDNPKIIIGTPIEIENELLSLNYDFDNVIIDEIHCLNNDTTIEDINYASSIKKLMMILTGQFLLLSATLTDESMENLKNHIELIKNKECEVIKHNERFINLQFHIMNNNKKIEIVNPFSQINLSEIEELKGKNMSITNLDIWKFWESSLDEDEFLPQMEKWFGNGLLNVNNIQKNTQKISKFIYSQSKDDPEFIEEVLEEIGSDVKSISIDMNNKEELNSTLFNLVMELKKENLLPAIIFQNDIVDCHEIHNQLINVLETEQDKNYPTYYEDKKRKSKEYDKIQEKIDKMKDSSIKIKSSSKQNRDSAFKAQEQQREEQKEKISNMKETQYDIDMNIHAPHPDYSCGITQISDESMRKVRWDLKLKISGYETMFMKGIQRGIGIYTHDMESINQHVMRKLIMDKNIGLLIADNSLAYGVNLPIRTVIIFYDGSISSQTILQQIGRAGRRGLDTQGNIIIVNIKNNICKNPVKEILMAKFPTINPLLDKKYFNYTELFKPFCNFETKKKSLKYIEYLRDMKLGNKLSLIKDSIEDKFITMTKIVFNNNYDEISNYLSKVLWLIDNHNVHLPNNSKFLCKISYNKDKNVSSIILYLFMPLLKEKFKNIKGISHIQNRFIFKLLITLYDDIDNNMKNEEILEDYQKLKLDSIFEESIELSYSEKIYNYYVHNNIPEDKKEMIEMKFRFITIHDILESIIKTIELTEFNELKSLFVNVHTKIDKIIKKFKCQFL